LRCVSRVRRFVELSNDPFPWCFALDVAQRTTSFFSQHLRVKDDPFAGALFGARLILWPTNAQRPMALLAVSASPSAQRRFDVTMTRGAIGGR
jgi:hypothetical protein